MKRLLFMLLSLLAFSESKAQINKEHLNGAWEFVKSSSGNALAEQNKNLVTTKIISNGIIATIIIDTSTRRVVSTLFGSYQVNPAKGIGHYNDLTSDSCVVSERYWASDSLANVSAFEEPWYGVRIENHDIMYQTKVGTKDRITWVRNNNYKSDYLSSNLFNHPDTTKSAAILPLKELNSKTFLMLRSKTRSAVVKPNKAFPKPFAFIKEDQIENIDGLLGAGGLLQYGERARYGALILWVAEGYYDEALKKLKAQKNL